MALPGASLDTITHVYSHEQGLFQCERYLNAHPGWRQVPQADTAGSARMVAALRMLGFSGLSVLLCVPANWALWLLTGREQSLGWMLALSLASLFLYGGLSLACQRLRGPAGWLGAPACWVLLGLAALFQPRAAEWLAAVPAAVFCLLAAAGIVLYLLELRRFCRRPMEGGVSYALR